MPKLLQPDGKRPILRLIALLNVLLVCLLLLIVQFSAVGKLSEDFFGLTSTSGILFVAISVTACVLCGGIQSLSIVRMLAYPALAIAFLTPLIWTSLKITGNPIPQLAFGAGALQPINQINTEMIEAGFFLKEDVFSITGNSLQLDNFNFLATLICLAFGLASMPHLLQHFGTVKRTADARMSGIWAYGFLLLILTAIPAVAAFAKLDIYTSLLGLQVGDLDVEADWVFGLSGQGNLPLIRICNTLVSSLSEAIVACGGSPDYFLSSKDISLDPKLLLLGSAALNELPELMTSLLAIGAMFALWSTADGLVLAAANSIANDGYLCLFRPKSPLGVRLFMTRFFLCVVVIFSTWVALAFKFDTRSVFEVTFAIASASLFPALLFRAWITEASDVQITIGMPTGLFVTLFLLFLINLGFDFASNSGDEFKIGLPFLTDRITPMSTGFIGVICSILSMTLMQMVRAISSEKQRGEVDVPA